jgi:hypothetical protein
MVFSFSLPVGVDTLGALADFLVQTASVIADKNITNTQKKFFIFISDSFLIAVY